MDTFAIDIPADLYQRIAAIAVRGGGESLTRVVERLVTDRELELRRRAAVDAVEGEVVGTFVDTVWR
ncbi:hypothetical protein AB0I28_06945 [Phytomonospora sp. NPDC050363]|uniref:hypothetical protein n=1 Tax=Phytomonospora sp. NPDC050363 TaxID=3155642 RepID=UPI003411CD2E